METHSVPPSGSGAPGSTFQAAHFWREYDDWNAGFAKVVYNADRANEPVYLDVEDELLQSVAQHLERDLTAEQAVKALCAAVRGTLLLGDPVETGSVFSRHRQRVDVWRSRARAGAQRDDPPPVVALLAVFARAAELMQKDDLFHANAYFPRLNQLLDIPAADDQRVQTSFRRESERFWGALNDWLTGLEGALGLSTAEAIGQRYVGIPLSQALIRAADRDRFGQFFAHADLEPGLNLSAIDMKAHLGRWIKAGNASISIDKMWRTAKGKSIVSDAAALALSGWDGILQTDGQGGRSVQPPVLTARITTLLNAKRLRLGFAVRAHIGAKDGLPSRWVIHSAREAPEVELVAINDRLLAPDIPTEVDALSLLTGELALRPVVEEESLRVSPRRPQPLVVLSWVAEAGLFVEVDRVRMLEPHLLLVNSSARRFNGPHAVDFDHLLAEIAEPGYTKDQTLKGLPDGWTLYRDVTVVRSHESSEALLEPLKPAQTSTLFVSGGLRLPGHAVRWHTDAPLTLRGSALGASSLSVTLTSADDEHPIQSWSGDADEITACTADLSLESGAYRAELSFQIGGKKQTSVATFSLCDSENPRFRPVSDHITYDPAAPLGALSAVVIESAGTAVALAGAAALPGVDVKLELPWWSLEPIEYAPEVLAAPSAPDSCAVTGSHHWYIETHVQGMRTDRAECSRCGRVKLFSPRGRLREQGPSESYVQAPLRRLDFGEPAIDISGETLLDALTWLGGGSPTELARVVRQVYDSALTVDEILRTLETLGHIDVARDPATLAVERWEMSPRCLAGLADGTWMAIGAWTRKDVAELADVSAEYGAALQTDLGDWIPRRVVAGLAEHEASDVGELLECDVHPDMGRRLLETLPPLVTASAALPRVSAEGIFDAEWFDSHQARWVKVQSIGQSGAFRTKRGFVSTYSFRTATDVASGELRRGDPRIVKHLANTSRPLVGYNSVSRNLFVPLGADLPGLYGRALTLQSGKPPARVQGQALLAYPSIDEDVARALVSLLKG